MARRGRSADPYLSSGAGEPIEDPFVSAGPSGQPGDGNGDGTITDPYEDLPGAPAGDAMQGPGDGAVDDGVAADAGFALLTHGQGHPATEQQQPEPEQTQPAQATAPASPPVLTPRGHATAGSGDSDDEAFVQRIIDQAREAALQQLQERKASRDNGRAEQLDEIRRDQAAETERIHQAAAAEIERLVDDATEAVATAQQQLLAARQTLAKMHDIRNQAQQKRAAVIAAADQAAQQALA